MNHLYPKEFASYLLAYWYTEQERLEWSAAQYRWNAPRRIIHCSPPEPEVLEEILSICYQASFLREENRPLKFRLILCKPDFFPLEDGPPQGFHRLEFAESRPCTVREINKLAPAIDFYRALIGVLVDPEQGLRIWGMVHSGPRWIQMVHGGRQEAPLLPCALVVGVTRPGRIAVGDGTAMIATLKQGHISTFTHDVFESSWIRESFMENRASLISRHEADRALTEQPWATIDPEFIRILTQQFVRRVLSTIRNAGHGGTIIYLPHNKVAQYLGENRFINVKYPYVENIARNRFQTLMGEILNTLAIAFGGGQFPAGGVGWQEHFSLKSEQLALLDEALFELAHMVAGLASVDGAVVLSKHIEILGFGAEISGNLPEVKTVGRALDAEGVDTMIECADDAGTRHRSAYRLCRALEDVVVVVISQDGGVNYVRCRDSLVTYWDQAEASVLDF